MVMKKATGGDSPLRQGTGKSFWTLRSRVDDGGGLQYVFWKRVRALRVFSTEGINRRKGDARGGPGGHTPWWRGPGLGHATIGCGWPLVRLLLSFGLRLRVR
jgi:hypothetical protein